MLDKRRSYSIVVGMPGAKYEQGGKLYRANGDPVDDAKPANDAADVMLQPLPPIKTKKNRSRR